MNRRVWVEVGEEGRGEGGCDGGLDFGNAAGRGSDGLLVLIDRDHAQNEEKAFVDFFPKPPFTF